MSLRLVLAALFLLPALTFAEKPPVDEKAEAILAGFAKYYTDAKSFQVHLSTTIKIDAKGQKAEMVSSYDLSVQRPNAMALVLADGQMGGSIFSDGTTQAVYIPMLKKYTTGPAAKSFDDLLEPATKGITTQGLPFGHEPLLTDNIAADLHENVTGISYVGPSDINGVAAHQVKIEAKQFLINLWIADGDKPQLLKSEIAFNAAAMPPEMIKQMQINEFRRTTLYTDWKINQPIAASVFQFQPPADAEKVDSFVPKGMGAKESNPLIGQPAPDFTLKDLTGQDVALSSLRGKTVVLDFWATWCPPCVKGLPIVAETTAAFKDKGVVFYAVNAEEDLAKINEFLKAKSLDIPVLLDSAGDVMKLYGVSAIPQSYIIDKEGVIRAAHRGLSPTLKEDLTKELTTLSSGGTLPAPPAP